MKFAGTTAPQCCELSFNYFTVLLTGSSSKRQYSKVFCVIWFIREIPRPEGLRPGYGVSSFIQIFRFSSSVKLRQLSVEALASLTYSSSSVYCPHRAKVPVRQENSLGTEAVLMPQLSSQAQAASAATAPSAAAVVTWRIFLLRQSPATKTPAVPVIQSSPALT